DDWLAAFDITMAARHNAAADALATAELLLLLRARAEPGMQFDHGALVQLSRQHRWLAAGR
ncbi:MAG: 3'-5' exonuclease, partial [Casimicrobiaceae bacterium]